MLDAHAARFLAAVGPLVAANEVSRTLNVLQESWSADRLVSFLASSSDDVVRVAARCLGFVGESWHDVALAEVLRHRSRAAAQAAEDALWNLWMRSGGRSGHQRLARAIKLIAQDHLDEALIALDDLCEDRPDFAEAHHQRALVLHSLDRLFEAEQAYQRVLELNPFHFAAAAALGHIALERDEFDAALRLYREALSINPNIPDLPAAVRALENRAPRRVVA